MKLITLDDLDDVPDPTDVDYPAASVPRMHASKDNVPPSAAKRRDARLVSFADVESRDVPWLWLDRMPAGMISVLDGPPGCGKSTVVCDLTARLTTGRPWPGAIGDSQPGNVVLIGHEDSPEHTTRPRLVAAGADVGRVHLLTDVGGRTPRLPEDGAAIEQAVRKAHAALLVIDPASAFIAADLHRDNDVRSALAPLVAIAQTTGCAVLLLRHLRKAGGTDAIYRGLGSVGITALARAALMLLHDPDDSKARILTWPKLTVGQAPQSLRFRFGEALAGKPPRIEWDATPCSLTADDILSREDERHRGGRRGEATAVARAETWLMEQFAGSGAVPVPDLQQRAEDANVAWRTVERAKGRLGIRARREGREGEQGGGRWLWIAPEVKAAKPEPLAALTQSQNGNGANSAPGTALRAHVKAASESAGDMADPGDRGIADVTTPAPSAQASLAADGRGPQ